VRNVVVRQLRAQPVNEQLLEIVERKGLGHPDSICDGVLEHAAVALARAYRQKVGAILHFNLDKGLLAAGAVEHRFGGGRFVAPMRLVVGDRATFEAEGQSVPVREIVAEAVSDWFGRHLPRIDPARHIQFDLALRPSSPELAGIFRNRAGPLPANDTSALVGYAPLSPTERLVLAVERFLNGEEFKTRFPDTGQDVKVLGIRQGRQVQLTVAMPLLEEAIDREATYFQRKDEAEVALRAFVDARQDGELRATVALNTLDEPGRGIDGVYLSLLGTSAEDADSGQVGWGNRVNGVISLQGPAPAEAAAGKNPVSHVGKIYNVLAHRIAGRIYAELSGLREVYVWLGSQIGAPLDQPRLATAQVILEPGVPLRRVQAAAAEIIEDELAGISGFTEELADGHFSVY
jgi:S-adenosylmethionine synthetase